MMKGSDIARHCLILGRKKRLGHNSFNTHKNAYASFGKTAMERMDTENSCSDSSKCKKAL